MFVHSISLPRDVRSQNAESRKRLARVDDGSRETLRGQAPIHLESGQTDVVKPTPQRDGDNAGQLRLPQK